MSVERKCKCGENEGIRYNFKSIEKEKEFHAQEYTCFECQENEAWIKQIEEMEISKLIENLETAITKIKNGKK